LKMDNVGLNHGRCPAIWKVVTQSERGLEGFRTRPRTYNGPL
jgi:hypothetical protein